MEEINQNNTPKIAEDRETPGLIPKYQEGIYPVISVEFKGNRRQRFSNPMEFPFKVGNKVVVRVDKGEDLGVVNHLLEQQPENLPEPEHEVLRKATAKDLKILAEYRGREDEAKNICKEKIANHDLKMKLVDVEYQFDGRKLIFYFTADGRIDFRQLVKDLAATFRTRIELRQIGTRDEIRRFGGLGPCGRTLCCVTFITEFCPITTQMAKDQNLPLNPNKISGCCGRLKCCLQHELDSYHDALQKLPRWDTRLMTKKGPAYVEKLDVFEHAAFLRYTSGDLERVEAEDMETIISPDFDPQATEQTAQQSEIIDEELILDDEEGCAGAGTQSPSASVQKQRKSDKRRPPHPRKRSGKHLQNNKNVPQRNNHNNKANYKKHKTDNSQNSNERS